MNMVEQREKEVAELEAKRAAIEGELAVARKQVDAAKEAEKIADKAFKVCTKDGLCEFTSGLNNAVAQLFPFSKDISGDLIEKRVAARRLVLSAVAEALNKCNAVAVLGDPEARARCVTTCCEKYDSGTGESLGGSFRSMAIEFGKIIEPKKQKALKSESHAIKEDDLKSALKVWNDSVKGAARIDGSLVNLGASAFSLKNIKLKDTIKKINSFIEKVNKFVPTANIELIPENPTVVEAVTYILKTAKLVAEVIAVVKGSK